VPLAPFVAVLAFDGCASVVEDEWGPVDWPVISTYGLDAERRNWERVVLILGAMGLHSSIPNSCSQKNESMS